MLEFLGKLLAVVPPEAIFAFLASCVAPLLVALLFKQLKRADQDRLKTITHGVYLAIAAVAKHTPTKLDDLLVVLIQRVEEEMGRHLGPAEKKRVVGLALALHGKPGLPDLGQPTADEILKALKKKG